MPKREIRTTILTSSHTSTLSLVLSVLVLAALAGPCTGEAVLEEDDHSRLIINTTDSSQPVLVNGVDVQALHRTVTSIVSVVRAEGYSQPCAIGLDVAALLGHTCESHIAGGDTRPWTLAARFSNDGVDTWTWNDCNLWSNHQLVGLMRSSSDFKGTAWFGPTKDLLFIADTGEWIAYENALDKQPLSSLFTDVTIPCSSSCPVYSATQMNITDNPYRCDVKLYVNPDDGDLIKHEKTCGFAWSFGGLDGCPLDDVGGSGSFGPLSSSPTSERPALGFLGGNPSATFVELYVR
ncbi:hypothetical protein PTSG_09705 [Salpingoeca rosetta]|uniref:Uncharacterized protein n=1 Tax=Salpingoeca rosetta (strain ATCC 50818 / BSB-021) TaxID=946362 RepID=F2UNT4_SALR5|nr:uncharacterized protein PTSG_09705 [Salpingoeca rosetta]EGD79289.1 hypothetical protein PTSG_09705 [Salpingoeca rosetta]|eukprot:XP_004989060.1 hypothetical protein PTSG_09705 [Salpingoeca rosetta]